MPRSPELVFEFPARYEVVLLERSDRRLGRVRGFTVDLRSGTLDGW
ncbi:MAG: hypothetical protein M3Q67_08905 [Actinomycetota bacterium]|nr:hypothetical protein [Actinomycetota bacterium]